jgi:hypothetical protein
MTPAATAHAPSGARGGPHEMIQELCSLGLTQEASVGILKVLMRSGARTGLTDPAEW